MKAKYWYLSFAESDPDRFLGGCVVRAKDIKEAVTAAWRLKINPGGQVLGIPVPPEQENLLPINRLLSRQEIEKYGPVVRSGDLENPPQRIGLS